MRVVYIILTIILIINSFAVANELCVKGNINVKKGDVIRFKFILPVEIADTTGIGHPRMYITHAYVANVHSTTLTADFVETTLSVVDVLSADSAFVDTMKVNFIKMVPGLFRCSAILPEYTNDKSYIGNIKHRFTQVNSDTISSDIINANKVICDSLNISYVMINSLSSPEATITKYKSPRGILKCSGIFPEYLSQKSLIGKPGSPFTNVSADTIYNEILSSNVVTAQVVYSDTNVSNEITTVTLSGDSLKDINYLEINNSPVFNYSIYSYIPNQDTLRQEYGGQVSLGGYIRDAHQSTSLGSKTGGLFFRFDNWMSESDSSSWMYNKIVTKFLNAGISLQIAESIDRNDAGWRINVLRRYQALGVEISDIGGSHHTSVHCDAIPGWTNDTAGIDSIESNGWAWVETSLKDVSKYTYFSDAETPCNIVSPNLLITQANGGFENYDSTGWASLTYGIVVVESGNNAGNYSPISLAPKVSNSDNSDPDTLFLADMYENSVTLENETGVAYHHLVPDALFLTVNGAKRLFEASVYEWGYARLNRPRVWVSPSPYFAERMDTLAIAGREYGILSTQPHYYAISGAEGVPRVSYKTFNEYDPNNSRAYGMEWGDFDIESTKFNIFWTTIVDGVAKHYVYADRGHVGAYAGCGLLDCDTTKYFARIDSLIGKIHEYGVLTGSQEFWSNELYRKKQDPYINIIPPLGNDWDGNDAPDGFNTMPSGATYASSGGLVESDSCRFYRDSAGDIATITAIGGLEKGYNEFSFWGKGASGDYVTVTFTPDSGSPTTLRWQVDQSEWTRYDESNSINGTTTLSFENTASITNITFNVDTYSSGTVEITYPLMAKKRW